MTHDAMSLPTTDSQRINQAQTQPPKTSLFMTKRKQAFSSVDPISTYLRGVLQPLLLLLQELAEVGANRSVHQDRLVEVGVSLG